MSKISKILIVSFCLIFAFWGIPQTNRALADLASCPDNDISRTVKYTVEGNATKYLMDPSVILPEKTNAIYFTLSGKLTPGKSYEAYIKKAELGWNPPTGYSNQAVFNGEPITLSIDKSTAGQLFQPPQTNDSHYEVNLLEDAPFNDSHPPLCRITNYKIGQPVNFKRCSITLPKSTFGRGEQVVASVTDVIGGPVDLKITYPPVNGVDPVNRGTSARTVSIDNDGTGRFTFYTSSSSFLTGASVTVNNEIGGGGDIPPLDYSCSTNFDITNQSGSTTTECLIGSSPTTPDPNQNPIQLTVSDKPKVIATNLQAGVTYWARIIYRNRGEAEDLLERIVAIAPGRTATFKLSPTDYLPEGRYAAQVYSLNAPSDPLCTSKDLIIGSPNVAPVPAATPCPPNDPKCTSGGGNPCSDERGPAFKTAIGCIHTNPTELIKDLLTFIIGISGGLAFLMMLLGAFQMLTSAGNPETLNAGKDRLTSAIIGLLFIIFAILLLQIIGAGILALPEFGK